MAKIDEAKADNAGNWFDFVCLQLFKNMIIWFKKKLSKNPYFWNPQEWKNDLQRKGYHKQLPLSQWSKSAATDFDRVTKTLNAANVRLSQQLLSIKSHRACEQKSHRKNIGCLQSWLENILFKTSNWLIRQELIPVSIAWSDQEY